MLSKLELRRQKDRARYLANKERYQAYSREYYRAHPEKILRYSQNRRARVYGITEEQRQEMITQQAGLCAICCLVMSPKSMVIDHCHDTGRVRGIVHTTCNVGIGQLRDNAIMTWLATNYLEINNAIEPVASQVAPNQGAARGLASGGE